MAFYLDSMGEVRMNGAAKLTLVTLLFVVSSLLLSCGKEGVALRDEGALSRVGEVVEARGGVRLFYGRPLERSTRRKRGSMNFLASIGWCWANRSGKEMGFGLAW